MIKNSSHKEGFIKPQKNYEDINMDIPLVQIHKYADLCDKYCFHKDDYRLH
jgi:hypothetical protein